MSTGAGTISTHHSRRASPVSTHRLYLPTMFRSILLLGLTTLALGLSTGDLQVSVKALHTDVDSIEDIVISAIITNPTDRDIRVFAKNNVLDASATTSFTVNKDGKDLLYTGIQVSASLFTLLLLIHLVSPGHI